VLAACAVGRGLAACALAGALLAAAPAGAESVLIQPGPEGEDNSPYAFIPSLVRGTNTTAYAFSAKLDGVDHDFQYFLKFDVSPYQGTVDYAYVWFYYGFGFSGYGAGGGSEPGELRCHRVLAPWSENTLTWNSRPPIDLPFYVYPNVTGFGHFFCKATDLVQGWIDGSIPNHGLALTSATSRLVGMFSFEAQPTLQEVPQGLTSADLKPSLLIRFHENGASDIDADGVRDRADNCAARANLVQEDWDRDRVGDACDVCPAIWDRRQRDRDGDGRGDRCGPKAVDLDRSGRVDAADLALAEAALGARRRSSRDARRVDTDHDGRVGEEDLSRWLSVYLELQTPDGASAP
jgi:hypothetical protein